MSGGNSTKAIFAAFLANLGIALAKFVAFWFTGSTALLAESVHSLADTGNQGLLILGGRRARRVADEAHPFGYARERYFWSFVVALVLFSLGSLFAIYEGIHKLEHPEAPEQVAIAFIVLGLAIGLESYSFITAIKAANPLRGTSSWASFIRRSKAPELPVVLLEDFGALAGLLLALISLVLTTTVDPIWDGIGTLCIGALLGLIAVVLAIEMKSLLIGEAASGDDRALISEAIESDEQVVAVIHKRTEHLGPDEILVATKVAFLPDLSMGEVAAAIDRVEERIRAAVPAAQLIFIEPDLLRDSDSAG